MRTIILWAVASLFIGVTSAYAQNPDTPGTVVVAPDQIGVVVDVISGELLDPLGPGTHQIDPLTQQVTLYSTGQQVYTMGDTDSASDTAEDVVLARTLDGLEVAIDVTVIYSVDPDRINDLHLRWGDRYPHALIRPVTRSIIREVVSLFEAGRIYAEDRNAFSQILRERLMVELDQENLILADVFVRNLLFSQAFLDALEQRALAEQAVERARLEVERAQIEEQMQANIQRARAATEAEVAIIRAQGLAEVWAILSPLLAENPLLIYLHYIDTLAAHGTSFTSLPEMPFGAPLLPPVSPDTD